MPHIVNAGFGDIEITVSPRFVRFKNADDLFTVDGPPHCVSGYLRFYAATGEFWSDDELNGLFKVHMSMHRPAKVRDGVAVLSSAAYVSEDSPRYICVRDFLTDLVVRWCSKNQRAVHDDLVAHYEKGVRYFDDSRREAEEALIRADEAVREARRDLTAAREARKNLG